MLAAAAWSRSGPARAAVALAAGLELAAALGVALAAALDAIGEPTCTAANEILAFFRECLR